MGIGGISDYSGLFRNYRIPEIPKADYGQLNRTEEVPAKAEADVSRDTVDTVDTVSAPEETGREKPGMADVKEISLSFNRGEDYSYIGSDSDISGLDMKKAISDVRKDKILWQYQYFVGEVKNMRNAEADGSVVIKF